MNDLITNIGKSIIQHGKFNDRIYLMKLVSDDIPNLIYDLEKLASSEDYSKIIAKVPAFAQDVFMDNGYIVEAHIPDFFTGNEDVFFMSKYRYELSNQDENDAEIEKIVNMALSKAQSPINVDISSEFYCKICEISDANKIVDIYKNVFKTYPFPIHDIEYIEKTMNENIVYFGIWKDDEIVSVSSSEMDIKSQNAEMTDFATLVEYRGLGFASYLLQCMENEMRMRNVRVVYTIARAISYGINILFSKSGYSYTGTLLNNTNISGNIENMNIWYKCMQ
ncbi:MAG: putative beta-lysine N-acetyltransferase [ANME-2 cluster archaeon]|nr:putative beta-lysine N-acetyltransferase [ANME-2 cluster archaeon]